MCAAADVRLIWGFCAYYAAACIKSSAGTGSTCRNQQRTYRPMCQAPASCVRVCVCVCVCVERLFHQCHARRRAGWSEELTPLELMRDLTREGVASRARSRISPGWGWRAGRGVGSATVTKAGPGSAAQLFIDVAASPCRPGVDMVTN